MTPSPAPAVDPGLRIAPVSDLLGVPVPTIRSWERRYGFPVPPRTGGSHRRYSSVEIDQLRSLRDLITKGYTARDAVAFLEAGGAAPLGRSDLAQDVVDAALRLDPSEMRAGLERAAEQLGVESTIRDVVFPSMSRIGSAWKAGNCEIEHEHLATEVVRTWLSRQSVLAPAPFRPTTVLLACGPKDLHTIGLEAFAVILARRGWECRVMGAMTPPEALRAGVRGTGAGAVVVTSQRSVTRRAAIESIVGVAYLDGVRVFYAGDAFASQSSRTKLPGVFLGTDITAAADVFDEQMAPVPVRTRTRARARAPHTTASAVR